jgi:acyl-coenzyme A thioesterase PaaI-like protein
MTIDLRLSYHRPVLLQTPLRLLARVTQRRERKLFVHGSITTAADPGTLLVEAEAVFLTPAEQAQDLFPSLRQPR